MPNLEGLATQAWDPRGLASSGRNQSTPPACQRRRGEFCRSRKEQRHWVQIRAERCHGRISSRRFACGQTTGWVVQGAGVAGASEADDARLAQSILRQQTQSSSSKSWLG